MVIQVSLVSQAIQAQVADLATLVTRAFLDSLAIQVFLASVDTLDSAVTQASQATAE